MSDGERRRFRILLLEDVHPAARQMLADEGCEVVGLERALGPAELAEALHGFDVVGFRSKTRLDAPALASSDRLLAVACFCIGTNQVDLAAANARGVPVFNAPFSNTRSVAELVVAEIVALSRQLGDRSREMHAGVWRKTASGCHEARGKTVGIVGYGHIGSQVGVLAEALGMRVLYFDVSAKLPLGNNRPCASLGELLERSDFVTLHVPATPQTHHMIDAAELARMRPGAYLLNASRGTVVVIEALAAALRSGHLGGAAVDVHPEEPERNGDGFRSALRELPNVLLTPHVGGSTLEAQEAIGREVASSVLRFLGSGATAGAVNFPHVEVPRPPGTFRILNVHRNVPGVLSDINRVVSEHRANIHAQVLATDPTIGYLVMDLDHDVSQGVARDMGALGTTIRTRVLS